VGVCLGATFCLSSSFSCVLACGVVHYGGDVVGRGGFDAGRLVVFVGARLACHLAGGGGGPAEVVVARAAPSQVVWSAPGWVGVAASGGEEGVVRRCSVS